MSSLQRLDQIAKPDDFSDDKTASEIQNSETSAVDFTTFFPAILSQMKRIIHSDQEGNWNDNIETVFGGNASLRANRLDLLIFNTDGGLLYDTNGDLILKEF